MMKIAVSLAAALCVFSTALAQQPVSRFITATFPPPAEIRKPDLTMAAVEKGPVAVVAYDGNGRFLATAGPDNMIKV